MTSRVYRFEILIGLLVFESIISNVETQDFIPLEDIS